VFDIDVATMCLTFKWQQIDIDVATCVWHIALDCKVLCGGLVLTHTSQPYKGLCKNQHNPNQNEISLTCKLLKFDTSQEPPKAWSLVCILLSKIKVWTSTLQLTTFFDGLWSLAHLSCCFLLVKKTCYSRLTLMLRHVFDILLWTANSFALKKNLL